MNKKIIICSGGTGGHVIPSVNLGNFLIDKGYNCILILDKRGEKYSNFFKGKIYTINSAHLSGNMFFKFKSILHLMIGFIQSLSIIFRFRPKNFISFGSYATLMPLFVILIFKTFTNIHIHIHEQNSVIGKVNSFFLPFAKNLFTNFFVIKNVNTKYLKKKIHVGLPSNNLNLKKNFKVTKKHKKINIFIFGGSQGSVPLINKFTLMLKNLNTKSVSNIKLFVQAQKKMHIELITIFQNLNLDFELKEFFINIHEILSLTDLAISRAGAGTVNDLINYTIPSIIIPLPHSINNHQYYNAKYLFKKKATILLDENNFNVEINSNILEELINNIDKRNIMIGELKKINIPNANKIMLLNIKKLK